MLRLNIRHELPQISVRQRQSRVDESSVNPATIHTNTRQAKSNKGIEQSSIQLNNYPSRRAYGARNMTDFTRERGQKGLSDAQADTSERTQKAWSRIENGAKPGNDLKQEAKSNLFAPYSSAKMLVEMNLMPEPEVSAQPAQVVGESDVGDVTADIDATSKANIRVTPGSAETSLQSEGYIRRWVTEGKYDIRA